MRTRVKICGITSVKDALCAVAQGADAIGLVFYAPSPRNVNLELARAIVTSLPPFVSVVGLFVNAKKSEIDAVLANVKLDILQFHGDETADACEQYNLPYLKAIRVKASTNLLQYCDNFSSAKALLLDAYSDTAYGGTGQVFDWKLIPSNLSKLIVLAGGLTPDNVAEAIRQVKPYAVDVSGGVELSKGVKSEAKIAAFIGAVAHSRS
ncbi:MAG: phosphoribosylanthranilate isomerase [Methylophilaceae bacterium]